MEMIAPAHNLDAFNCPHCNAYSQMQWRVWQEAKYDFHTASCHRCSKISIWTDEGYYGRVPVMVYPSKDFASSPCGDMPENVKEDYLEASKIAFFSPRGACALLRLALQKLMVHLGEPGKNINQDIRSLAQKDLISPKYIKLMDTLRLFGNDSVHPGEIREEDIGANIESMFLILNKIVEGAISDQKMFNELYEMTSETKRTAAEEQDQRNKAKGQ